MSDSKASTISASYNRPAFGTPADKQSILVPAFGFNNRQVIPAFLEGINAGESRFRSFRDRYVYNPDSALNLSELLGGGLPIGKWLHTELWDAAAKPEGLYYVGLLVEGIRSYRNYTRARGRQHKWLSRLRDSERQCSVAWIREDGTPFESSKAAALVSARRSACGAVYSRHDRYDEDGKICGMTTRVLLLQFHFKDKRPDLGPKLAYKVVAARAAYSHREGDVVEPDVGDLDPVWSTVMERARTNFVRDCRTTDPEARAWTDKFLAERESLNHARKNAYRQNSYVEQIKSLDWEDALNRVNQPWQLKVVIDTHCNTRFDESVHRSDTNGSRVGRMLGQHNCSDERRRELRQMVSDFVEPMDELWSYSGD